jgi:hypothetical protein
VFRERSTENDEDDIEGHARKREHHSVMLDVGTEAVACSDG